MEADEKEAQIQAKYRKEIEERVAREVARIKEAEKVKRAKIQAEQKAKESKLQLMEKIRNELNKIAELEEVRKVQVDKQKEEEETALRREKAKQERDEAEKNLKVENRRKKLLDGIQAQRTEEEMRIREEARKLRLENEAKREIERKKREQEKKEARARALEEEKRRITEVEEEARRRKVEAEVQRRKEEARKVEEKIASRKREEREREIQRQKDLHEQITRDNEALRKKELENKKKKFIRDTEKAKKVTVVKRNSLMSNAILQKFEQMSLAAAAAEEEEEARKRDLMKKKAIKKMPQLTINKEKVLKRSQSLFKKLKTNKEGSKETLKKSLSKLAALTASKCKLMNNIKEESNNDDANMSKKNMQNYLISRVLFDGNESVNTREKTPEAKDTFFETYKEEMEKYLSLFDEKDPQEIKKSKKTPKKIVESSLTPVNHLRNQFEFPSKSNEEKKMIKTKEKRTGKMRDFKDVFRSKEDERFKKKTYVPIIIDKDAFERTLGKFESQNQSQEYEGEVGVSDEENVYSEESEAEEEESLSNDDEFNEESTDTKSLESISESSPEDDVRDRILLELNKIKEAEKQFNDKIQRENKKKELLRAIQEEISKINALTGSKEDDEPVEEPEWINRFKSFKYREEANPPPLPTEMTPVDNDHEKNDNSSEDVKEKNVEDSSHCDYKEMIEALLSLTEDSQASPKVNLTKRKPIASKPLRDIKSKFEGSDQLPKLENRNDQQDKGLKVNFVKNILLKAKVKDTEPSKNRTLPEHSVMKKTASNIKSIFEGKTDKEVYKKDVSRRPNAVKVPQVFDVEESNEMKARVKDSRREWKYKQKQMSNLGQFLQENAKKLPPKLLDEGTRVLANHNTHQSSPLDSLSDETESLMDSMGTYLQDSKDNSAFMETLQGYLDLIEEDTAKEKVNPIKFESAGPNIRDLQYKLTVEDRTNAEVNNMSKKVGKISRHAFEKDLKKEAILTSKTLPNHGLCSNIKDHLEKKSSEKKTDEKIRRKKIIVEVNEFREGDSIPKGQANVDWKWKKKCPEELWAENSEGSMTECKETTDTNANLPRSNDAEMEDLIKRSQILRVKTQEREKYFEDFLSTLRNYSTTHEEDGVVNEIDSYLQLIDETASSNQGGCTNLPHIDVPWKIDRVKSKLSDSEAKSKTSSKVSIPEIGKLSRLKDKIMKEKKSITKDSEKDFTPSKPIDGIKNQLQEIMGNKKPRRSMSEMNLVPTHRFQKRVVVPEFVPQNKKEKNGKWHNKLFEYFKEDSNKSTFSYKKQTKVEVKSKWDSIEDPEERKRAILEKHGFKPRPSTHDKKQEPVDDIPQEDTFLSEKAYKEYLREHTGIDSDEEKESQRNGNAEGSISSLLNILGSVRKSMLRRDTDQFGPSRMAQSEMDISQIPGSCSNIRRRFENPTEMTTNEENRSRVVQTVQNPSFFSNPSQEQELVKAPRKLRKGSFDNLFRSESSTNISSSSNSELEVLRCSSTLRRQYSEQNLDSGRLISAKPLSSSTADLDSEVMEELSRSNSAIKAMFEASAPKYKFGQKLSLQEEAPRPKRPQKQKETRQWVLDSVNKFFDVIVEEEEDERRQNDSDSEDDDVKEDLKEKSHINMKGLLVSVMSDYKNISQECLLNNFKKNLGSQLLLKRQSVECLNT